MKQRVIFLAASGLERQHVTDSPNLSVRLRQMLSKCQFIGNSEA